MVLRGLNNASRPVSPLPAGGWTGASLPQSRPHLRNTERLKGSAMHLAATTATATAKATAMAPLQANYEARRSTAKKGTSRNEHLPCEEQRI